MAAFYRATLAEFLVADPARIIGSLASGNQHNELQKRQIKAWEVEVRVLKATCRELLDAQASCGTWSLLLEYPIPRRHKRLDGVLLAADVIFCLEFKTEDKGHSLQSQRQAEDYALDLRDFHAASRDRTIVPVVVVPKARPVGRQYDGGNSGRVREIICANSDDLARILLGEFEPQHSPEHAPIDPAGWDHSSYCPIPSIIEAATALYAGHDVSEIEHSFAGATNLTVTSTRLVEIIQTARRLSEKIVCFVTGIPGAGKTLAGLKVVHDPVLRDGGRAPVFLSGNGPLVKIVSAAIAQDHKRRKREVGAVRTVGTSIQNVHTFVREGFDKPDRAPVDQVVVFDEAQRAWNGVHNFKKNGVEASEPETMLSIMDRHRDWAVVIALVGGGQEIHNGEAGLAEWGTALREKFPNWKVAASPHVLTEGAHSAGFQLFPDGDSGSLVIQREASLHLDVCLRSWSATEYAKWVDAVLAGESDRAAAILGRLPRFPIALTRSLSAARQWLRHEGRGMQRAGLIASSGAVRLRADGLEMSSGFRQGNRDMFVHWFLAHPPDIRSSGQLEVAASEFECQGLELDWVGACWGGDLTYDPALGDWSYRNFSGTRWGYLKTLIDRQYLLNTYRVLLTRARRGLVVWIPRGDDSDPTRLRAPLDATADYLVRCGLRMI